MLKFNMLNWKVCSIRIYVLCQFQTDFNVHSYIFYIPCPFIPIHIRTTFECPFIPMHTYPVRSYIFCPFIPIHSYPVRFKQIHAYSVRSYLANVPCPFIPMHTYPVRFKPIHTYSIRSHRCIRIPCPFIHSVRSYRFIRTLSVSNQGIRTLSVSCRFIRTLFFVPMHIVLFPSHSELYIRTLSDDTVCMLVVELGRHFFS